MPLRFRLGHFRITPFFTKQGRKVLGKKIRNKLAILCRHGSVADGDKFLAPVVSMDTGSYVPVSRSPFFPRPLLSLHLQHSFYNYFRWWALRVPHVRFRSPETALLEVLTPPTGAAFVSSCHFSHPLVYT